MKFKSITSVVLSLGLCASMPLLAKQEDYLSAPTGTYSVGFQDFHWINNDFCPDPNFTGTNQEDFSQENARFCHELVIRTYYPTVKTQEEGANYYSPFVHQQQNLLRNIPGMTEKELQDLDLLKTYSFKDAPIVASAKFPVLIFVPGFTFPAQVYENSITELVSHGYIVVGINTPFMNLVELPNSHVITPSFTELPETIEEKYVPMQIKDVGYVLKQLQLQHSTNSIFAAMDLNHIGALGHSVGGRVIADVSHENEHLFVAAATLDIGFDTSGNSTKQFAMPFLHLIAADRISTSPIRFELGAQNYLVGITPNQDNHAFSKHMNFSDLSTLQYMPLYKKALPLLKLMGYDMIGDGNGLEVNAAINAYLIAFFDMYLKQKDNAAFNNCKTLVGNTYMNCGNTPANLFVR